ncbi:PAS domain-containing protein [Salipiger sp. IMCC34102]|uniref:PAS domain-containing protein n=1 Tax=Salipiger sp. IMCC34102 TaxID=2510647 RepID=UPI0013EA0D2E|nr:PAS domain-containing protein [Salipiger sp. IMCC34102]
MPDRSNIEASVENSPIAMVLTDPNLEDNPLVYVNEAFEKVTLYKKDAVLGRNCRLLQCEDTDPAAARKLGEAIEKGQSVSVDLLNEKADGTRFMNQLVIAPIRDDEGKMVAFLGIQNEMKTGASDQEAGVSGESERMLRELQHRVKNHLAMVVSMIRIQSRRDVTQASFEALSHRVQSLALLYEELSPSGVAPAGAETVPAGAYLSRVANTIGALDGRASIRLNISCDEIELPMETAARLGLLLTEFVTNALEHAFEGREEGVVQIRFTRQTRGSLRLTVEDDGIGLPEGSTWPDNAPTVEQRTEEASDESTRTLDTRGGKRVSGAGGSIVSAMVRYLDGDLNVASSAHGTILTLDIAA